MYSSIDIKPAIRIEVTSIGAENGRIAMDDPRVDSDDGASWEIATRD
jgi:hypothetical protein